MSCKCCSEASAPGGRVDYQYAVKIVCGLVKASGENVLPPGEYFTKTNIHNFSRCDCVTFRWKVAVGLPNLQVGPISDFAEATLCPDEALEIGYIDILKRLGGAATDHVEGWLVIETPAELDVVAVYATAQSAGGPIVTFATERVEPRCMSPCDDLNLNISTGVAVWDFKGPGSTVFTPATLSAPIGSWGTPPAGSSWIIPGALQDEGYYTFRLTFKLCSGFTNPSLNLSLLADYHASVFLNGQQIQLTPDSLSMLNTLNSGPTNPLPASDFKAGPNELTVVVHNSEADTPVGLALHGTIVAKNGKCSDDGVQNLECPKICYEVFVRPLHGLGVSAWTGPACDGSETAQLGNSVIYAFRAHLTGSVPAGTTLEYRGYNGVWTSWTPAGQTCGNTFGGIYMTAFEFRLVGAPVCCRIGYQIRTIPGWSNWAYDGQQCGVLTGVNVFAYALRVQISCV